LILQIGGELNAIIDYIFRSPYLFLLAITAIPYLIVATAPSIRWMLCAAAITGVLLLVGWVAVFQRPPHWEADFHAIAQLLASTALVLACALKALTLNLAVRGFSFWLRLAILVAGFFAAPIVAYPVSAAMSLLDIPMQPRLIGDP
jgi:hypothetical protein